MLINVCELSPTIFALVVNFINVLPARFSYDILAPKITKLKQNCKAERFSFVIFGAKISAKKAGIKC
jgi:hypothetical protein